jgi:hypothetical protein
LINKPSSFGVESAIEQKHIDQKEQRKANNADCFENSIIEPITDRAIYCKVDKAVPK